MNKNTVLISSCLLLFSTQLLADRPAMSDRDSAPEMQESTAPTAMPVTAKPEDEKSPASESPIAANAPAETSEQKQRQQTGDVLELQPGETLPVQTLDFPRRGMSMDKVKNELGEPIEITPAIGEPPITSWSYSDCTVYFEHSKVIHAVSNR